VKQTPPSSRATLDALAARLTTPQAARVAADLLNLVRSSEGGEALSGLPAGLVADYRAQFAPPVLEFIAGQERLAAERLRARAGERDGSLAALLGENRWGAYNGMARALDLADDTAFERVAVVGCGPFPDSLFCLHDRTSTPELVGFDRDREAVETAVGLVAALDVERISIRQADAAELDYGGFDLVCCSVFATPRQAILARIAETAPQAATVLVREPAGIAEAVFEPVLRDLPERLRLVARTDGPQGPLGLAYAVLAVTESRNERSMKASGSDST
jgi:hypothetical protein